MNPRVKQTYRRYSSNDPGIGKSTQYKRKKKTVDEKGIPETAETEEMTRLRNLQKVKLENKHATPPSRPPRVGEKLLTAIHRGEFLEPVTLRIREQNDSQPPPETSDSDETPDEDQSILSGRGGNDDGDQGTLAATGDKYDDDQETPPARGGNADGDNNDDGKNDDKDDGQGEIVEEEGNGQETGVRVKQEPQAVTEKKKVIDKPINSHMSPSHLKNVQKEGLPGDGGHVLFVYDGSLAY